jgi:DNA-binding response OmpR family regulator
MAAEAVDVIVVDDDLDVGESLRHAVRSGGYTVCDLASDSATALELMRRHHPKLAIIDVNLRRKGEGIDLARTLAGEEALGIMFLTGYPDQVRAVDIGHAWLPKPYRVLDLLNALDVVRALSQHGEITSRVPPQLHLIEPASR